MKIDQIPEEQPKDLAVRRIGEVFLMGKTIFQACPNGDRPLKTFFTRWGARDTLKRVQRAQREQLQQKIEDDAWWN